MSRLDATISLQTWNVPDIILKHYTYSAEVITLLPSHAHPEDQFWLSFDCQGEYTCRGSTHSIPMETLSIIQEKPMLQVKGPNCPLLKR